MTRGKPMKRRAARPTVSDHAVLRYLERARGMDIEGIRRHIAGLVRNGVELSGEAVIVEGVKFVLVDNSVVTVLERGWGRNTRPDPEPGDA